MKRGEVYEYTLGSQAVRVLVVSHDRYSSIDRATGVLITAPSSAPVPGSLIVAVTHPLNGHINVTRVRPLDPSAVRARLGRLTATDTRRVDQALRTYLDLD